jgi:hypothetical protein
MEVEPNSPVLGDVPAGSSAPPGPRCVVLLALAVPVQPVGLSPVNVRVARFLWVPKDLRAPPGLLTRPTRSRRSNNDTDHVCKLRLCKRHVECRIFDCKRLVLGIGKLRLVFIEPRVCASCPLTSGWLMKSFGDTKISAHPDVNKARSWLRRPDRRQCAQR